jgi:polyferredoxin
VLLIVIPVLIGNAGMHSDYRLPFCQICPAKPIMPLFEGNFQYFSVNVTNSITIAMTVTSLILAAFFVIGMFFKDRFFCIFCPMLAILSLIEKVSFFNLKKNVDGCIGCGTCQRVCTMDIRDVHMEREKSDVQSQDCMLCMKCAESCAQDNVLTITLLGKRIFSSSKDYVSGSISKLKR